MSLSGPKEVRTHLGQWLRRTRQRREWTLPMLSSRSGVPVSTLSRLERKGNGGIDALLRVLQALGMLDEVDQILREHLRRALLPETLAKRDDALPERKRIRPRPAKGAEG